MSEEPQSWTSWILSSYASSVSPADSPPESFSTMATSASTGTSSPTSSHTSFSPWGPYTRSGRGGAGNFIWQSDLPFPTGYFPDLEAQQRQSSLSQRQRAAAVVEAQARNDVLRSREENNLRPEYAQVGRGGAGNYVPTNHSAIAKAPDGNVLSNRSTPTSSPLSSTTPTFPSFGAASSRKAGSTRSNSPVEVQLGGSGASRAGYYGRGGAGNLSVNTELVERARRVKVEQERRVQAILRLQAERDVGNMLKPPEGALLAVGRDRLVRV